MEPIRQVIPHKNMNFLPLLMMMLSYFKCSQQDGSLALWYKYSTQALNERPHTERPAAILN